MIKKLGLFTFPTWCRRNEIFKGNPTVLIKLCLETPLSGLVVDYRIATMFGGEGGGFVAILHSHSFETDPANVTTS